MAGIERRARDWRVVWRQAGAKQYEVFATEAEALKFKALVEAHGNRWPHGWTPGRGFAAPVSSTAPTFEAWARRSIASRAKANARTRHDYLRDGERHLFPTFGQIPVDLITREQVGAWLIDIDEQVAPKTAKNLHNLASSIMTDAVDQGFAARNPFHGALKALPSVKHEEMVFLTRREFEILLGKVTELYRPLVLCLAHTGARWSEATALQIHDVDLNAPKVRVVRAWKRTPEDFFELGEPKSRRSRRTIVISQRLAETLRPLVESRNPGEFVFTTKRGRPVRHNNFHGRVWEAAVAGMRAAGVTKSPRIHDLRHSHASWLIADKVSLPAIQRRLGHESITTTIDRYGHLMPEVDAEVGAALDGWMDGDDD